MTLNALEEQIMELFWKLGKAFPKEIITYLEEPKPPYFYFVKFNKQITNTL